MGKNNDFQTIIRKKYSSHPKKENLSEAPYHENLNTYRSLAYTTAAPEASRLTLRGLSRGLWPLPLT